MPELTLGQKTALDEFKEISDVLAVPTIGEPLLSNRKWTLPCPDKKALADHPDQQDQEVQKCLGENSRLASTLGQEPQASETSSKQMPERGSSKQAGKEGTKHV